MYKKIKKIIPITFFVLISLLVVVFLTVLTPISTNNEGYVKIEKGDTLSEIAEKMVKSDYIYSKLIFKTYFHFINGSEHAKAGVYHFDSPKNIISIIDRLKRADYRLEPIKVLIPEGSNVFEIAEIANKKLPAFDKNSFLDKAQNYEGYLFPDTYLFSPNHNQDDVLEIMLSNFEQKVSGVFDKYKIEDPNDRSDIIKLASIIEEEAFDTNDRRKISGVLYNRLEMGMPLQVDVTFQYINGKNSYELTKSDLKDDSPYNTYTNVGLPPTAISNPGLDSILAAIEPVEHNYYYFLANRSGSTFFSETFDEHVEKKKIHIW